MGNKDAITIRPGERLDALDDKGLKIIQHPGMFRFGTDSILLADFAGVKPNDRVADFGTGTGILSILSAARCPGATFDAIEIQPEVADMAARSVMYNSLEDRVTVHTIDLREAAGALGHGGHTLVICNPPYGKLNSALVSAAPTQRAARHEADCTIDDIAAAASALLKNGGRFAAIYPAPRAFELMRALNSHSLAPKRIRTVGDMPAKAPKFVLLDAVKGGGSQLHWLPPLILRDDDGTPSAEWKRIYRVE